MNQEEIERCKNDPIYFFDKYTNVNLTDYQREALKPLFEKPPVTLKWHRPQQVPAYLRIWYEIIWKATLKKVRDEQR